MPIVQDAGITGRANNGTTVTAASVVCSAADTRLIVLGSLELAAGPAFTSVTRNSLGFTQIGNRKDTLGGGIYNVSAWYQDNPSIGTFSTVASWTGSTSGAGIVAIPIANCDISRAPLLSTGSEASSTSATCTVTGGSGNDLQMAAMLTTNVTSVTSTGSNQSVLSATPSLPLISINGAYSLAADYITQGNPGNFSWTIAATAVWISIGITIFGFPSGTGPAARCIYIMP